MNIPCIQRFKLNEVFMRYQNGIDSVFYFYLFYVTFYKTANMIFSEILPRYKYTTHICSIIIFYQIGYHSRLKI